MMKVSPARMIVPIAILTFLAGISVGISSRSSTSHVPQEDFAEIVMLRGASYQASMKVQEDSAHRATLWMREDRYIPFIGDTGITGETMYTNLTIDCNDLTVAINEQRAFTAAMEYLGSKTGEKIFTPPTSLLGITAVVAFCGPPKLAVPPASGPTKQKSSTVSI